jgi:exonuclease III
MTILIYTTPRFRILNPPTTLTQTTVQILITHMSESLHSYFPTSYYHPPVNKHPHTNIPTPRTVTFNFNSLSQYNTSQAGLARRDNMISNLRALMKTTDIICGQETHLLPGEKRVLTGLFPNWVILYNNHPNPNHSKTLIAGTIILISPKYHRHYYINHLDIGYDTRGYIQVAQLQPKIENNNLSAFQIINLYLPAINHTTKIPHIKATLQLTNKIHTFALGDFNFVEQPEDASHPRSEIPEGLNKVWITFIDHFKLRENHQPLHTRTQISTDPSLSNTARLDRIYSSYSEADLTIITPFATLPHIPHNKLTNTARQRANNSYYNRMYLTAPDHHPVLLSFINNNHTKTQLNFRIPLWIASHNDFHQHVITHYRPNPNIPNPTPHENINQLKRQFIISAKTLLRRPPNHIFSNNISKFTHAIKILRLSIRPHPDIPLIDSLLSQSPSLQKILEHLLPQNFYKPLSKHINSLLDNASFSSSSTDNLDPSYLKPNTSSTPPPLPSNNTSPPVPPTRKSHSNNIIEKAKLEIPSTRTRLTHLRDGRSTTTDRARITEIIRKYWTKNWALRTNPSSISSIDNYINAFNQKIPHELLPSLPTRDVTESFIMGTSDSSPGPDGVPFAAYRGTIELSTNLIQPPFPRPGQGKPTAARL